MRAAVLVVTLVLASVEAPQTSVTTSYLCVPDYGTGFSLSNGEWQPTRCVCRQNVKGGSKLV